MPLELVVPIYEHPLLRFLQGRGELKLARDGPATSLGELIVHTSPKDYPLLVSTSLPEIEAPLSGLESVGRKLRIDPPIELSRAQVLMAAWQVLEGGSKLGFGVDDKRVRDIIHSELNI